MMKAEDKQKIKDEIQDEHEKEKAGIDLKYFKRQIKLQEKGNPLQLLVAKHGQSELEAPIEIVETETKDPNKLPDDYTQVDVTLQIPALNFTIDNEFKQQLLAFNLINFNVFYKQKNKIMKATINLEDYKIVDSWSGSENYNLLLDAVEDEAYIQEEGDQETDNFMTQVSVKNPKSQVQALSIQYEANEDWKACPYHVKIRSYKSIQIVVLVPLINELQRTMNAAFED